MIIFKMILRNKTGDRDWNVVAYNRDKMLAAVSRTDSF